MACREKRRFLRESTEANGGEEIDGESCVPWVVAREQAFEKRLQSPDEETAMIYTRLIYVHVFLSRAVIMHKSEATHMSLSLSLSFGSPM